MEDLFSKVLMQNLPRIKRDLEIVSREPIIIQHLNYLNIILIVIIMIIKKLFEKRIRF